MTPPPAQTAEMRGRVVARTVAVIDLTLAGPAHFGGGEGDATDALVLTDGHGDPLIPGSTFAGALRSHLRRLLLPPAPSDGQRTVIDDVLAQLFGGPRSAVGAGVGAQSQVSDGSAGEGDQSALVVYDAYPWPGKRRPTIEQRDSVAIEPDTRTARPQAKFDYEVLARGTLFRAALVLEVREGWHQDLLENAFALALRELRAGRVRMGAMAAPSSTWSGSSGGSRAHGGDGRPRVRPDPGQRGHALPTGSSRLARRR